MAVIHVKEIAVRDAGRDDKYVSDYLRRFQVVTDDAKDAGDLITLATGVPRVQDPYITANVQNTKARCRKVRARCPDRDNPFNWELDCEYTTRAFQPESANENPLARPAVIEWDGEEFQRPFRENKDLDDKPFLNTAGDPFDPPVEQDQERPIVRITRNQASFEPSFARLYANAVNEDTWFGYEPFSVKCKPIRARSTREGQLDYWIVTYEFHLTEEGELWIPTKVLNAGFHQLVNGQRKEILIGASRPSSPVPLNEQGGVNSPLLAPVNLKFRLYRKLPFGPLNLP